MITVTESHGLGTGICPPQQPRFQRNCGNADYLPKSILLFLHRPKLTMSSVGRRECQAKSRQSRRRRGPGVSQHFLEFLRKHLFSMSVPGRWSSPTDVTSRQDLQQVQSMGNTFGCPFQAVRASLIIVDTVHQTGKSVKEHVFLQTRTGMKNWKITRLSTHLCSWHPREQRSCARHAYLSEKLVFLGDALFVAVLIIVIVFAKCFKSVPRFNCC